MSIEHFGTHRTGSIPTYEDVTEFLPLEGADMTDALCDAYKELESMHAALLQRDITIAQLESVVEEMELDLRDATDAREPIPANENGWYITDVHIYTEV